jgi:hypothetical protein
MLRCNSLNNYSVSTNNTLNLNPLINVKAKGKTEDEAKRQMTYMVYSVPLGLRSSELQYPASYSDGGCKASLCFISVVLQGIF